jgi:hypothetical protein
VAAGAILTPDRAAAQPGNPIVNAIQDLRQQIQGLQQQVEAQRPRQFYLTTTEHDGSNAPAACATGYHMASIWEVFQTSGLRYERTLGTSNDDSGFGPPANLSGWIRTGANSQAAAGPGDSNCNAYTSNAPAHNGTLVQLSEEWDFAGSEVSPWSPLEISCNIEFPVWCIED